MGQVEAEYVAEQPRGHLGKGHSKLTADCGLSPPGLGGSGPPRCWPRTEGGQARMAGIRSVCWRMLEDRQRLCPEA